MKSNGDYILAGKDLLAAPRNRLVIRTPFDGELLSDTKTAEYCLDHVFENLGVSGERVDRTVWLTEPLANPGSCRAEMNELLFELYGVPSVGYSVDGICSYLYNAQQGLGKSEAGLSIHSGFHSTSIVPILNDRALLQKSITVPLGGFQCLSATLQRLQIRHPALRAIPKSKYEQLFSLRQAQELVWQHCYTAQDYAAELSELMSTKPIPVHLPPPQKKEGDEMKKGTEGTPGKKRKNILRIKIPSKRKKIEKNSENPSPASTPKKVIRKPTGKAAKFMEQYKNGLDFQIHVERISCVETLFQPALVGETFAGLGESIQLVLDRFTKQQQVEMAKSVLLSGGNANWRGLARRVQNEIQCHLEPSAEISVKRAKHCTLDAYRGLTILANENYPTLTRDVYEECGKEYLKEHFWSNVYYTPAPPVEKR